VDGRSSGADRRATLEQACRSHGVAAVYLFGSRADEGLRVLAGGTADRAGSDLDVGLFFDSAAADVKDLAELQVAMEDVFAPIRVDLVPLHRVDALFQFHAIDGHRVYTPEDAREVDRWELVVMRRAAELLPIQRELERDLYGVSTS
jgi:predicted nucleotidyltransferase